VEVDEGTKAQVFISYSRRDITFADQLESSLKRRGFEPLIDREEIYAFEDWWKRIESLIELADTVVFILSPDAVASDVALKEVAYAASLNKRFAPIVCRRVPDEVVPEPLRRLNFIFFDQPMEFEASVDRLADALQTDIDWVRRHTEYGEAARNWSANKRPAGLLLRSPALEEAERWISSRPRGAPAPTEETRSFVTESRRSTTRRRNILTSTLTAGLIVATVLAGLVYWQRGVAVRERDLAEHNAAEAKAEKDRADKSAVDARAQRDVAERETAEAEKQAALAGARADLNQSQLVTRDAPRDALRRALDAAKRLDARGAGEDAVVGLSRVLNSVRELPLRQPYGHYRLSDATVLSRQQSQDGLVDVLVGGRLAKRPLTVIGSYDLTGVIDDDGRPVGPPIGSGEVDRSYANDAAWYDDNSFLLATGSWRKANAQTDPFSSFHAGLRHYRIDGTLVEEYLVDHVAPVTAVAVFKLEKQEPIIIAGDAFGNILVKTFGKALRVIPTGVTAPVKRIIVASNPSNVVVLFGRYATAKISGPVQASNIPALTETGGLEVPASPDSPPIPDDQKRFDIKEQLKEILAAIELPTGLAYLGNNPADDVGCGMAVDYELFICNRNAIDVWRFEPGGGLTAQPDYSFPAQNASVTAIAASPISPFIAAGYADGQIRLWQTNRALLSDLYRDEKTKRVVDFGSPVGALGFTSSGRRLLGGSPYQMNLWDLTDIAAQFKKTSSNAGEDWTVKRWKQHSWVTFGDHTDGSIDTDEKLAQLVATNDGDRSTWVPHGRFLIAAHSGKLDVIDAKRLLVHQAQLPGHRSIPKEWTPGALEEDKVVAAGSSGIICVLYGTHDKNSDDRRLYAIDEEAGSIEAEWSWPDEFKAMSASLAVQRKGDETSCWAGVGNVVAIFSSHNASPQKRTLDLLNSKGGDHISQLELIDNSDVFVLAASLNGAQSSIVALASFGAPASGSLPTANVAAAPTAISIIALKELNAQVHGLAINPSKSLIAVAVNDRSNTSDVREVRLFDWNFSTLMSLPGISSSFQDLCISSDGKTIRGTTWNGLIYEQEFSLRSLLNRAESRLDAWTENDDQVTLIEKGVEEKDWTKGILIFQQAVDHDPIDAQATLLLANRTFFTANSLDGKKSALALYDKAFELDPYDPLIYYMRGRARAVLRDYKGAISDFTAAIGLPHILPRVKVIAGFLGINYGISQLSEQLNLQARAELYLRRAAARTAAQDWQGVLGDVSWLKKNTNPVALAFELEGIAWDNLRNNTEAASSYQQAAAALQASRPYAGFEEMDYYTKEAAWLSFKIAFYELRTAKIYQQMAREEAAATAAAAAQEVIRAAYASPALSAKDRARLDQLADRPANRRCDREAQYRSIDGDQTMPVTFVNRYTSSLYIYWLDYTGRRTLYSSVAPGNSYSVLSAMTHPWLVTDSVDKCIAIYLPGEQVSQIIVQKVRLGIVMADIPPPADSTSKSTVRQGVLIKEIIPQSPAEAAGLKPGDIIVKINDNAIDTVKEAQAAVQISEASLVIHVLRDGSELNIKANLQD
jgi:WD40 repeat protein